LGSLFILGTWDRRDLSVKKDYPEKDLHGSEKASCGKKDSKMGALKKQRLKRKAI